MVKFYYALLLFVSTTCKSQDNKPVTGLSGAYLLLSQSLEGNAADTTFTERKQLKIYTDHYMMYVRLSPEDLLSSFGIGTFSINKGKLTEHIIYSASGTVENENSFSGTVNISKRLKGYEQVIPEIISERGRVRLTEDYQLLDESEQSPLDGTWKLAIAYTINKKDTTRSNAVKYKTYYKGNFCAGSYKPKPSGKKNTLVEYGTFRINGNKVKENIIYSTIATRKDHSYALAFVMKGNDTFTTTDTHVAGLEEVEKYTRMK